MQHVFSAQPMEKLLLPRSVHGEEFQVRVSFITFHSTHDTDISPFRKRMLTCRSLCAQGKQRCQGTAEGPFPRAPPCSDTPPPSPRLLRGQGSSLHQGVLHSTEVQGAVRELDFCQPQEAVFCGGVQPRGETAVVLGACCCLICDQLQGLAFLLLVPKQAIKTGCLVCAGGLEGVSLLHCDLSFLLADNGLPHGIWKKKAKVSSSAGKAPGCQLTNQWERRLPVLCCAERC